MADPTYGPKVYMRQGGDAQVIAAGGALVVETGAKIDMPFKSLAAAGRNGAGLIALAGAAVGDRVRVIFGAPTAGGALANAVPGTDFEAVITVINQVQQINAGNLSANTYVFVIDPVSAP